MAVLVVVVVAVAVGLVVEETDPPAGIRVSFNRNNSIFGWILVISSRLNLQSVILFV